jgi:glucosyl-3-phosphoglycerate synthase
VPALNEQDTVGDVVATIRGALVDADGMAPGLVDDLLVIDSGSTDATADRARAAGARVLTREEALPGVAVHPGKGEVLWRSCAATDADLLVFIDADLRALTPAYVTGLLGPLLASPSVQLVKGCYDRPLEQATGLLPGGGGRVTELVARPLLSLHWPALTSVIQPLAGEWAIRRAHLRTLRVPVGYGVELAALIDTHDQYGLDGLAQVDLGTRVHRNQPDPALGRMAAQIWHAAMRRLPAAAVAEPATEVTLRSWVRVGGAFRTDDSQVDLAERSPMDIVSPAAPG